MNNNIFWLPKENIGLIKELNSISKLARINKKNDVIVIIGNFFTLMYMLVSNFLNGKKIKLYSYNISSFSFINILLARLLGFYCVQFLHEPGMKNKLNYGALLALKIVVLEILVSVIVKLSNHLVVFSSQAERIIRKKYGTKLLTKLNLLPYTNVVKSNFVNERHFGLLFVGRIHKAKNIEIFLKLSSLLFLEKGIKSKIISVSKKELFKLEAFENKSLKIISENYIPDRVIEDSMRQSKLLFKLDKNMMQSGLVVQAGYFGINCCINKIEGFTQDFTPHNTLAVKADWSIKKIFSEILKFMDISSQVSSDHIYRNQVKLHKDRKNKWLKFLQEG
jgi:hypothetical protein